MSRRVWIGIGISGVFLALFVGQTDFSRIGQALQEGDYPWVALSLPVYFLGVWFRAQRWHHLLLPLKRMAARRLFPVVVIGYMANDLLPLRTGELVRAYVLGAKEGLSKTAILGTVAVERLFDGVTLVLFMLLVALFIPLVDWLKDLLVVMAVLFLSALVASLLLVVREGLSRRLAGRALGFLPERMGSALKALVQRFLEGMRALREPQHVAAVLFFSALAWLCEATMFAIIGLAFQIEQPFHVYLLATAAANLATTLPSSQGGIGPFEYFCAQTLILFGTEAGLAAAYTIVVHAALLVPVILLGFVYLWAEHLTLGQVMRLQGSSVPDD